TLGKAQAQVVDTRARRRDGAQDGRCLARRGGRERQSHPDLAVATVDVDLELAGRRRRFGQVDLVAIRTDLKIEGHLADGGIDAVDAVETRRLVDPAGIHEVEVENRARALDRS